MVIIGDRNDRPIESHTCSDRFLHGETSWQLQQKCFTTQTKTGDWNLQHDSQKNLGFFGNWYKSHTCGKPFCLNSWQKGLKNLAKSISADAKIPKNRQPRLPNILLLQPFKNRSICLFKTWQLGQLMHPRGSGITWKANKIIPLGPRWMPCQILISLFFFEQERIAPAKMISFT